MIARIGIIASSMKSIVRPETISGMKAWYKADVGVTGTATVTAWADQSGNGYNLTAPSGKEPSFSSNQQGGYPAISFSGNSRLINSTLSQTQALTVIVIGKVNSSDSDGATFIDSYNNQQCVIYRSPSPYNFSVAAGVAVKTIPPNNNYNLHIAVFNGSASVYSVNTTSISSSGIGPNGLSGLSVGEIRGNPTPVVTGYSMNGYISEIVIYNRALTTTEISQLQTYYNSKYFLW